MQRPESTRPAARDTLLVGALLLGANLFWSRHDIGWMMLNPSPWLLFPLLMGGRWGFRWGMLAGLAAVTVVIIGLVAGGQALAALVPGRLFFLSGFIITGFLAGEISSLLHGRNSHQQNHVAKLEAEKERLATDFEIVAEAKHELQQRLAVLGADSASLDQQLRALFSPGAPPLPTGVLRTLRDTCGVTEAAFYQVDEFGHLRRTGSLGASGRLPVELSPAAHDIVRIALEKRDLVTVRNLWTPGATDQSGPGPIAVMPWLDAGGRAAALVVIGRMKFTSVTWRTFARLRLICRWTAQFAAEAPASTMRVVAGEVFQRHLELAAEAAASQHTPSALAIFEAADSAVIQDDLAGAVAPLLHSTAVAASFNHGSPANLRVLLPCEGRREADELIERATGAISRHPALAGRVASRIEWIGVTARE